MFLKRNTPNQTVLQYPFNEQQDHYRGSPDAPLEVLTYSDFQCPHCGTLYTSLKLLKKEFGRHLKMVYRHYPVPAAFPLSLDAALAAECAALQGLFWPMHDRIFENQPYLVQSSFLRFASDIGLTDRSIVHIAKYKKLLQRVLDHYKSGLKNGVIGTPTIFINGELYAGNLGVDSLQRSLQSALDKKTPVIT